MNRDASVLRRNKLMTVIITLALVSSSLGLVVFTSSATAVERSLSFSSTVEPYGVIPPGETVTLNYDISVEQNGEDETCLTMEVYPPSSLEWTVKSWNGDDVKWDDKRDGLGYIQWGGGPRACQAGDFTFNPRITFYIPENATGVYNFTATIYNEGSLKDTVVNKVEIGTENSPPVASFDYSPNRILVNERVDFDADASVDPQGEQTITDYRWDFDDDGQYERTGRTASYRFERTGSHTVSLEVEDERGATDVVTRQLSVEQPPNDPPSAAFSVEAQTVVANESSQFIASASSDPQGDGTISTYRWDFDGDGQYERTGEIVEYQFTSAGTHSVTLVVADERNRTDVVTNQIVVEAPPSPQFSITPHSPRTGTAITFDAGGSTDPDSPISRYQWDFQGDGTFEAEGPVAEYAYSDSGTYIVTLRVVDNDGISRTLNRTIVVEGPLGAGEPTGTETRGNGLNVMTNRVNLQLKAAETNVTVDDPVIVKFSVANLRSNEKTLHAQLILEIPSDWSVSNTRYVDDGTGQYSRLVDVEPGETEGFRIEMRPNEPGGDVLTGQAIYYFGSNNDAPINHPAKIELVVHPSSTPTPESTPTTEGGERIPGFGVGLALGSLGGAVLLRHLLGQ